jgi:alpha-tubulin suppressor-like RCC1 family protein
MKLGQLADGTRSGPRTSMVEVTGATGMTKVALGNSFSAALVNGRVYTCGTNYVKNI